MLPRLTSLPDDCFFNSMQLLSLSTPRASSSLSSLMTLLELLSIELDFFKGLVLLGFRLKTALYFLLITMLDFLLIIIGLERVCYASIILNFWSILVALIAKTLRYLSTSFFGMPSSLLSLFFMKEGGSSTSSGTASIYSIGFFSSSFNSDLVSCAMRVDLNSSRRFSMVLSQT